LAIDNIQPLPKNPSQTHLASSTRWGFFCALSLLHLISLYLV